MLKNFFASVVSYLTFLAFLKEAREIYLFILSSPRVSAMSVIFIESDAKFYAHLFLKKLTNCFDLHFASCSTEPPQTPGKPYLLPGLPSDEPDVVTIKWSKPKNDNGSTIIGYIVEHRRT